MIPSPLATTTQAIELDLSGLAIGLTIVLAIGVIVFVILLWRAASSSDPHVFASDDERRERERAGIGRQGLSVDD